MHGTVGATEDAKSRVDLLLVGFVHALAYHQRRQQGPKPRGNRVQLERHLYAEPRRVGIKLNDHWMHAGYTIAQRLFKERPGIFSGARSALARAHAPAKHTRSRPRSQRARNELKRRSPVTDPLAVSIAT